MRAHSKNGSAPLRLHRPAAALAAIVVLAACDAVQTGETGLLSFSWNEKERGVPVDFDAPVAVGMTASVRVSRGPGATAGPAAPTITAATSSAPEVLEVLSTRGETVTLRARAEGRATLSVTTDLGEDRIEVRAAGVHSVSLYGPGFLFPEAPTPLGVVGGRMLLPVAMRDLRASQVIGSGPLPLAVTVEPAGAATLDGEVSLGLVAPVFQRAGLVMLRPAAGDAFTTTVVAPADLVGLELRGLEGRTQLDAGTRATAILRGLIADQRRVAGLDGVVSLAATPGVCAVHATPALGDGVHEVEGLAPGACELTATVAGEGGLSESWRLDVVAAP